MTCNANKLTCLTNIRIYSITGFLKLNCLKCIFYSTIIFIRPIHHLLDYTRNILSLCSPQIGTLHLTHLAVVFLFFLGQKLHFILSRFSEVIVNAWGSSSGRIFHIRSSKSLWMPVVTSLDIIWFLDISIANCFRKFLCKIIFLVFTVKIIWALIAPIPRI